MAHTVVRDYQCAPAAPSGGTTTSATPGTVLTLCLAGEVEFGGVVVNPVGATASLMIDITGANPAATPGGTTFEIPAGGAFSLPRSSLAVKVRSAAVSHSFSAWRA